MCQLCHHNPVTVNTGAPNLMQYSAEWKVSPLSRRNQFKKQTTFFTVFSRTFHLFRLFQHLPLWNLKISGDNDGHRSTIMSLSCPRQPPRCSQHCTWQVTKKWEVHKKQKHQQDSGTVYRVTMVLQALLSLLEFSHYIKGPAFLFSSLCYGRTQYEPCKMSISAMSLKEMY